jgi:hypothetical protein
MLRDLRFSTLRTKVKERANGSVGTIRKLRHDASLPNFQMVERISLRGSEQSRGEEIGTESSPSRNVIRNLLEETGAR